MISRDILIGPNSLSRFVIYFQGIEYSNFKGFLFSFYSTTVK